MRGKVVLVPFPFDDLSSNKVRPAVCLTDEIPPHQHIVVAFITSRISLNAPTDFEINTGDPEFAVTGLKISSTIRLHRLMTVSSVIILRELGELSSGQQVEVDRRLRKLFLL